MSLALHSMLSNATDEQTAPLVIANSFFPQNKQTIKQNKQFSWLYVLRDVYRGKIIKIINIIRKVMLTYKFLKDMRLCCLFSLLFHCSQYEVYYSVEKKYFLPVFTYGLKRAWLFIYRIFFVFFVDALIIMNKETYLPANKETVSIRTRSKTMHHYGWH